MMRTKQTRLAATVAHTES